MHVYTGRLEMIGQNSIVRDAMSHFSNQFSVGDFGIQDRLVGIENQTASQLTQQPGFCHSNITRLDGM